jgi:hypothetical protein
MVRLALCAFSLPFAASACAAGDAIEETVATVADNVEQAVAAVPAAAAVQCDAELKTMQVALEAFTIMTGGAPVIEADLVTQGFLRAESEVYDLDPTGAIIPTPGSICT